ncbi:MAG: hypothetical protein ACK4XK_03740 [Casimicrobiaceae bacterium]
MSRSRKTETVRPGSREPEALPRAVLSRVLSAAMSNASHVVVGGVVFSADYLQLPDEFTQPDDVLVEGSGEQADLLLTQRDFEGARLIGEADLALADGTVVRFLRSASVH